MEAAEDIYVVNVVNKPRRGIYTEWRYQSWNRFVLHTGGAQRSNGLENLLQNCVSPPSFWGHGVNVIVTNEVHISIAVYCHDYVAYNAYFLACYTDKAHQPCRPTCWRACAVNHTWSSAEYSSESTLKTRVHCYLGGKIITTIITILQTSAEVLLHIQLKTDTQFFLVPSPPPHELWKESFP